MFEKSVIIRRIENTFKNISLIQTAYEAALDNQHTNIITGGTNGNAKISDPTANKAINKLEPKVIKSVLISYTDSKKQFHTYEIHSPASWIRLYEFVETSIQTDAFKRVIFKDRYQNGVNHVQTALRLKISKKTYFNLRNEIMALALAGACQLNLVKVME